MTTTVEQMIKDLQARESILNDWETTFVGSIQSKQTLTDKQKDRLEIIWEKKTTEKPIVRTGTPLRLHVPEVNFILDSLKHLEGAYNPDDAEDKNSALYFSRKLQAKLRHQLENPR
jgi:hypothetical protein